MKASELRIGNLLLDKDNNLEPVYRIHEFDEGIQVNDTVIESFSAIPLNEKWLLKFGFEKDNDFKHPNAPIYFADVRGELVCFLHNCTHRNIKTVHQLQNLYFALCGEEPELK